MMNKSCLVILLLLLFSSCTSDIDQMVNGLLRNDPVRKSVFHASTELPSTSGTKVYADEDMKVLWNADDRISIFNLTTYNYQFAFTGDDGDTAGGFELIPDSGFITGTNVDYVYAAYPYSKTNKLSNQGVFTMVLPAEQSYKEHSFGIGANTMVAVTEDNFLAFKNVGGYLSLRLYGDDVKVSRITIKGNNGEKLAGKASIEMPLGGVPTVTMDNSATDEISVVCNPAVKIGADANSYTDFWFVIPPVYFSLGFTITVTDDKGGVFERATSKALTINRNTLEWMAALEVVPDYTNANVPFEDANFKAYCVENFDKDGDGEVSIAEAEEVLSIRVSPENIASLGGIEFFKNLTSLDCSVQANESSYSMVDGVWVWHRYRKDVEVVGLLTSLDLSSNTSLKTLSCYGNQLTSLNISNNLKLESLGCGCNLLTSLDISSNTELNDLSCGGNRLSSLNISNNDNLTSLYCSFNLLTTLDINTKTDLTFLNCKCNQLTSLDVSHCAALKYLYCDYNQLTSLVVSYNTELTELDCGSNQLTSLDLSNNHSLSELDCSNNQLASLSLWVYGWTLTKFDCSQNRLTSLEFPDGYGYPIQELNCGGNEITTLNLANLSSLRTLNCKALPLTAIEVPRYVTTLTAEAFQGCSQLTEVIVPAAMTEIGDRAFADCPLLTAVKMHKETPPALGSQAFEGSPDCLIYVVSSSIAAYQAAEGWSDYYDRFRAFSQTGSHEGIGYDIWE